MTALTPIRPEDYGVTISNTAASNDANMASLMAAYPGTDSIILWGPGTYKFSAMMNLPVGPVHMEGAGPDRTILQFSGTSTHAIRNTMASYSYSVAHVGGSLKRFRIEFDGSSTAAVGGLYLRNVWFWDLDQLSIRDFPRVGLYIDGTDMDSTNTVGTWWNTVRQIDVRGCSVGIRFTGSTAANGGHSNANTIIGGFVSGCTQVGVDLDENDGSRIYGLDIQGPGAYGMWLSGTQAGDYNLVSGLTIRGTFTSAGIDVRGRGRNALFEAPTLDCDTPKGIWLSSSSTKRNRFIRSNFASTVDAFFVDDSAPTAWRDLNMGSGELIPFHFAAVNITASTATTEMLPIQASSGSVPGYYLGRPYQIRALSFRLDNALSSGSLRLYGTIGGTIGTISATATSASVTGGGFQGMGLDTDTGSNRIGVKYSAPSMSGSGSRDVLVTLWVEFTDE